MARKKTETAQMRLPVDVIRSARIVAAFREQEPGEFLAEVLRPLLAKMQAEEIAKAAPKAKGGK